MRLEDLKPRVVVSKPVPQMGDEDEHFRQQLARSDEDRAADPKLLQVVAARLSERRAQEMVAPPEETPLAETEELVCARCKVEGSEELDNGTCDTCGAAWMGIPFEPDNEEFTDDPLAEAEKDLDNAIAILDGWVEIADLIFRSNTQYRLPIGTQIKLQAHLVDTKDWLKQWLVGANSKEGE